VENDKKRIDQGKTHLLFEWSGMNVNSEQRRVKLLWDEVKRRGDKLPKPYEAFIQMEEVLAGKGRIK